MIVNQRVMASGRSVVSIMALGDSLTAGYDGSLLAYTAGFRPTLLDLLGFAQSIGTQTTGGGPGKHKGYSGAGVATFRPGASAAVPTNWIDEFANFGEPRVALVLIGLNGFGSATYIADIVDPLLAGGSVVKILCAPLVYYPGDDAGRLAFNTAMIAAVQAHAQFGVRVFLASSMATALGVGDIGGDNQHPNASGYAKIAGVWRSEMAINRLWP